MTSTKKDTQYLPGLDGLRAIAVIAIIIFHLNPKFLPGGFLGVDTFFIISGYLITTILLKEYRETGSVNLFKFYTKRIKRLFPAIWFLLVTLFAYCLLFEQSILHQLKKDIIAAFFYVSNWWYIFDKVDYFQALEPRPLQHLWSLAIEEQFYIFFPLILLVLLKKFSRRTAIITFTVLAVISAIWMAVLYHPGMQVSRLYFGTDTRLQTMLLGVLLAFIWPAFRLKREVPPAMRVTISAIGIINFVILLISFTQITEATGFLYQGGFFILGLITISTIASCVHPGSLLKQLLSLPFLTYIGRLSYSLYLWHFPVIVMVEHHFVKGQVPFYAYIIEIALTILFAWFSYEFIETPFRREGFSYFKPARLKTRWPVVLMLLALVGFSGYSFFQTETSEAPKVYTTQTMSDVTPPKLLGPVSWVDENSNGDEPQYEVKQYISPLFIGDSVLVDINQQLKEIYPNATIDGEVGRSIYKAIPLADQYSYLNKKDQIVVLGIGTNGDFEEVQLESLLAKFNKAKVYLVTARVPLYYESHVNQLMKEAAKNYKNVEVIDWYAVSSDHSEYFASDGIHLEYPGIQAMIKLLSDSIK
ncbi:acyltransferase family protein [Macrococcus brunensis]|uniref:acyltransferase family protein n=1 Tax=Macrococcus brunensis TaxID=198483 RepID=UPI001EF0483B|nr:acyltransferase family protein [Macrococcus brunensis]ULG72065.1 acetyltransferase [Macrococcus brunensis]